MRRRTVKEIVLPLLTSLPSTPSVLITDRIAYALELMAVHGVDRILVTDRDRPVGMVRFQDAMLELGCVEKGWRPKGPGRRLRAP